jgi:hypothetical protein
MVTVGRSVHEQIAVIKAEVRLVADETSDAPADIIAADQDAITSATEAAQIARAVGLVVDFTT